MLETADAKHTLLQSSMTLFRTLLEEEAIECDWEERGLLFVHDSLREFEAFAETETMIRERYGVGATAYAGDELSQFEPTIKPGFGGGWHYEGDCHLRSDRLLEGLRERLEKRGAQILEATSVSGFVKEGHWAKAVSTDKGNVDGDHFVVATGALTPFLNEHLGFRVPIQPGKGYSITMSSPASMPSRPLIFEDSHVAITPLGSSYRIGSTMEFVGYDTTIHPKRLGLLTTAAKKYLLDPVGERTEEEWFGWRPMTWDGKPIIDRSPSMHNTWIAAGHGMLGLSTSTGTGKLICEMISKEEPHIDVAPFRASRFQ